MAPPILTPTAGIKTKGGPTTALKATKTPQAPPPPSLPVGVPPFQKPGAANPGPFEVTHYIPIPLGGRTPGLPVTGVFLPKGFTYVKVVDVVLFFHGNRGPTWPFDTIDEYWGGSFPKGASPILMREDLNSAKKRSTVLIAPTLGMYPGGNTDDLGIFAKQAVDASGGFLEQVFAELAKREPKTKGMSVGNLVLAGHSGGGNPVYHQLGLIQKTTIAETWVFDGVYVDLDLWTNAITDNHFTQFFFHYATKPQKSHADNIEAKLSRKKIEIDRNVETNRNSTYANYTDLMGGKLNATFKEGPVVATGDHYGALTKNFFPRLDAATWMK